VFSLLLSSLGWHTVMSTSGEAIAIDETWSCMMSSSFFSIHRD
jgi:hypothetical protein